MSDFKPYLQTRIFAEFVKLIAWINEDEDDEAPTAEDIISINRNSLGNWHVWYKTDKEP
jgi:hypothetical protein